MLLRDALREVLAGWENDVDPAWQPVLAGTQPAFDKVNGTLVHEPWEPIFPQRRDKYIPGAPSHGHIFRAFDGLPPERVKFVVLGQDPYPHVARATGRSFEQGDLAAWYPEPRLTATSLRHIVQAVAYTRKPDPAFLKGDAGWAAVIQQMPALKLGSPKALFDRWQKAGVLWLNTGLTLSRFEGPYQMGGHIPLWAPIIKRVLTWLVERQTGQVVFLLWGNPAKDLFFKKGGPKAAAVDAGSWETRVNVVTSPHPVALPGTKFDFLVKETPFKRANDAIVAMGGKPLAW
jgi:uracil-DNA glycosylase